MTSTCTYDALVTKANDRAIRCFLNHDFIDHWIPRGQIQCGTEVHEVGDHGQLIVSRWFAETAKLPQGKNVNNNMDDCYPNSGALFKNENKKTEKHPDYSGTLDFSCEHCGAVSRRRIAGWIKESRLGKKFLSLSFKPAAGSERTGQRGGQVGEQEEDSDIPFIINTDISPNRHLPRI